MNDYSKELEMAKKIALEAGEIMQKYFDGDQQVEKKADNSPVTIADKLVNTLVIKMLQESFSSDLIIGEEESTGEYGMGRRWICDPIDGTKSFIRGIPAAMFSLALVIDGKPVLGVAYDPFLKNLFYAVKGRGAFCNDNQIRVSNLTLKDGVVGLSASVRRLLTYGFYKKLINDNIEMTTFDGAVYKCCLVARGKFVGYIEYAVNPHDIAASHVIVEEAGGKMSAIDGSELDYSKPFKGAIISNGIAHDALVGYCRE